ncbi:MAG: hypothetical protein JJE07_00845 [Flavobacteriaceae bacterium]|nr:hypothetical protein [Flavobacteriaceae bacterium]
MKQPMKICIWCRKDETQESFDKKAHTIPQSLGGKNICENVCDKCNHYFGSPQPNLPSSELVLKEMLNISKYYLLKTANSIPKNKRYKSEYFNINWNTFHIKIKPRYSLKDGFQKKLGRQFRKAMFKVFLEERERQRNDALADRFNFIREFARYDLGNYPIYIHIPKFKVILGSLPDIENPQIRFTDHSDEMDKEFRIYGYQLLGHNFLIPTSPFFDELCRDDFLKYLVKDNHPFGTTIKRIDYAENIDYTFRYIAD